MATNAVTWKWVAGILSLVLLGAGGGWMGLMNGQLQEVKKEQAADRHGLSAQIQEVKKEQAQDRAGIGQVDRKVGIIEEQTKRTQEDVREIKDAQREQNKKLDELLRRSR